MSDAPAREKSAQAPIRRRQVGVRREKLVGIAIAFALLLSIVLTVWLLAGIARAVHNATTATTILSGNGTAL